MLLVNLAYLFNERAVVVSLMRNQLTWGLLVLFFGWPVIGAIYPILNGYSLTREVVLQAFYFTTLLGSAVYVLRVSYARARLLVCICFWVSIFGLFAQFILPSFFMSVAPLAEGSGEAFAYGRAAGFFVNPNVAGRFVILLYLVVMLSSKKLRAFEILIVTTVAFAGILLTASRSSLLIALVAFVYVVGHKLAVPYIRGRLSFNPGRIFIGGVGIAVVVGMAVFVLPIASKYVLENTDVGATKNASQRFDFFTHGISGFIERVEEEALLRWYTVEPYVEGFKESWLFGKGLAGYRIYKQEHYLALTPHNTIFAMWMNYGVFYVIFGFTCYLAMALSPRMRLIENHLKMIFSPIMFIVLIGIMFTYDGLFAQRGLYIMIGIFLALYCAPNNWLKYDQFMSEQSIFKKKRRRGHGRRF